MKNPLDRSDKETRCPQLRASAYVEGGGGDVQGKKKGRKAGGDSRTRRPPAVCRNRHFVPERRFLFISSFFGNPGLLCATPLEWKPDCDHKTERGAVQAFGGCHANTEHQTFYFIFADFAPTNSLNR